MIATRAISLWLSLVVPSGFIVMKYLGGQGAIAYATVVAFILVLKPRLPDRLSRRNLFWLSLTTLLVVVARSSCSTRS